MIPKVEALGFAAFASGSDVGLTPQRLPLAEVDLERDMRYLVLSPFPPSYRDPAFALPATAPSIRPLMLDLTRNDSASGRTTQRIPVALRATQRVLGAAR